jgi:hypothetical protein
MHQNKGMLIRRSAAEKKGIKISFLVNTEQFAIVTSLLLGCFISIWAKWPLTLFFLYCTVFDKKKSKKLLGINKRQ